MWVDFAFFDCFIHLISNFFLVDSVKDIKSIRLCCKSWKEWINFAIRKKLIYEAFPSFDEFRFVFPFDEREKILILFFAVEQGKVYDALKFMLDSIAQNVTMEPVSHKDLTIELDSNLSQLANGDHVVFRSASSKKLCHGIVTGPERALVLREPEQDTTMDNISFDEMKKQGSFNELMRVKYSKAIDKKISRHLAMEIFLTPKKWNQYWTDAHLAIWCRTGTYPEPKELDRILSFE